MTRMMLKDTDWTILEPLLPKQKGKKGKPRKNDRIVIEGILWVLRTGAPWRDLPSEFGSWKTIYWPFNHWTKIGLWEQIWSI